MCCSASVLALDDQTLLLIAGNATITLVVLALIYRPLVIECVDPGFLRSVSGPARRRISPSSALVVLNLVAGFHALGTLLAVGIMMLPAAIARFWARDITLMIVIAAVSGAFSGYVGLLLSYPHRRAVGSGDHPGRGRALRRLAAVRPRRRAGAAGASAAPSRSLRIRIVTADAPCSTHDDRRSPHAPSPHARARRAGARARDRRSSRSSRASRSSATS